MDVAGESSLEFFITADCADGTQCSVGADYTIDEHGVYFVADEAAAALIEASTPANPVHSEQHRVRFVPTLSLVACSEGDDHDDGVVVLPAQQVRIEQTTHVLSTDGEDGERVVSCALDGSGADASLLCVGQEHCNSVELTLMRQAPDRESATLVPHELALFCNVQTLRDALGECAPEFVAAIEAEVQCARIEVHIGEQLVDAVRGTRLTRVVRGATRAGRAAGRARGAAARGFRRVRRTSMRGVVRGARRGVTRGFASTRRGISSIKRPTMPSFRGRARLTAPASAKPAFSAGAHRAITAPGARGRGTLTTTRGGGAGGARGAFGGLRRGLKAPAAQPKPKSAAWQPAVGKGTVSASKPTAGVSAAKPSVAKTTSLKPSQPAVAKTTPLKPAGGRTNTKPQPPRPRSPRPRSPRRNTNRGGSASGGGGSRQQPQPAQPQPPPQPQPQQPDQPSQPPPQDPQQQPQPQIPPAGGGSLGGGGAAMPPPVDQRDTDDDGRGGYAPPQDPIIVVVTPGTTAPAQQQQQQQTVIIDDTTKSAAAQIDSEYDDADLDAIGAEQLEQHFDAALHSALVHASVSITPECMQALQSWLGTQSAHIAQCMDAGCEQECESAVREAIEHMARTVCDECLDPQ